MANHHRKYYNLLISCCIQIISTLQLRTTVSYENSPSALMCLATIFTFPFSPQKSYAHVISLLLVCFSLLHCSPALAVSGIKQSARYTFSRHSGMNYFSLWIPSALFCSITFPSAVINPSSNQLYNLTNNTAP